MREYKFKGDPGYKKPEKIEILIFFCGNILRLGKLANIFDRFEMEFSDTYSFTTRYFTGNTDYGRVGKYLKSADYIFISSKTTASRTRILNFINERTISSKILLLYVPLRERELMKSKYSIKLEK